MRRQICADEAGTFFQISLPVLQFVQQTNGYGSVVEATELIFRLAACRTFSWI